MECGKCEFESTLISTSLTNVLLRLQVFFTDVVGAMFMRETLLKVSQGIDILNMT